MIFNCLRIYYVTYSRSTAPCKKMPRVIYCRRLSQSQYWRFKWMLNWCRVNLQPNTRSYCKGIALVCFTAYIFLVLCDKCEQWDAARVYIILKRTLFTSWCKWSWEGLFLLLFCVYFKDDMEACFFILFCLTVREGALVPENCPVRKAAENSVWWCPPHFGVCVLYGLLYQPVPCGAF